MHFTALSTIRLSMTTALCAGGPVMRERRSPNRSNLGAGERAADRASPSFWDVITVTGTEEKHGGDICSDSGSRSGGSSMPSGGAGLGDQPVPAGPVPESRLGANTVNYLAPAMSVFNLDRTFTF